MINHHAYMFFFNFRHVLHKYANEDVSLGAWFIGLDVEHIDDRRLCCGTPPGNFFPPSMLRQSSSFTQNFDNANCFKTFKEKIKRENGGKESRVTMM